MRVAYVSRGRELTIRFLYFYSRESRVDRLFPVLTYGPEQIGSR